MKRTFNKILFALGLLPFFAHGQIPPEVPLQSMVTVSDLTFYEHQSEYFTARDTIIVAGNGQNVTLNSGSSLTFTAGNSIILRPGFKAKSGSYAHAKIATGHQTDTLAQINQNINTYQSLVSQPGKNYIRTYIYRDAVNQYDSDAKYANIDIVYYDGLGRPIETVALKASPTGKDMVQMQTYDNYGRPNKSYLPFASNTSSGVFVPEQAVIAALPTFLNSNYDLNGNDANYGYSKPKYDDSPLNRVLKQGAPGADWQPESHPVTFDYQSNAGAVSSWRYDNNVKVDITYQPGSLFVTHTTDEDGKPSRTYTDKQGRLVMTEVDDGVQWLQTRYCYDGLGNLRCVMQPMANHPIDAEYCFLYEYNKRKKVIKKHTPGKGFEYFIYDARDRLVLRADSTSKQKNKWYYQKYDLLNRVTETGYIITSNSISNLTIYYQNNTDPYTAYDTIRFQERLFYDDYPTIAPFSTTLKFAADDLATAALKTSNTKGLLVAKRGGIVKTVKDHGFSTAETFHYDKYGRVIQHVKLNHLNEVERVSTLYDFTGQPIKTRQIYNYGSPNAFAVYMEYTRDHRGRLLKTEMKVSKNGTDLIPATIVEANVYNEAGLLQTRYLHSQNGSAFLQKIDYAYNIRGWLTKINDPLLSSGEGDRFGMALYYNRTPTDGFGFYNGNISNIKWASHSAATNQQQNFVYDSANRLTQSRTTNMGSHTLTYATNYGYDKNGNFTYLKRYGNQGQLIDDIEYGYKPKSNRLDYAYDPIGNYFGIDDYTGTLTGTNQFSYDLNGNLSIDNYRSIAIAYNQFNLPMQIDFENKDKTAYIYTSSGQKTAREVTYEDSTTQTTHYMGPFVFTQSGSDEKTLSYLLTPNGRLLNKGLKGSLDLEWEYFLTDHLGNVRTVITPGSTPGIAAVKQINNYYPFGLKMSLECYSISDNKYLYNNKEFEDEFDLFWYYYGARFYDPAIGRTTTIDPHAESYYGLSAYNMFGNNPMLNIDPTGMDWYSYTDDDGNEHYKYQDGDDESIEIDGNTYANIGSSVSINLNDDVYLNAFQNLTMTSYGEAVDLKGKILNNDGLFHKYIKDGSDLSMNGRIELFENRVSKSIGEDGLRVMKGIGAVTGGAVFGGELIGVAPVVGNYVLDQTVLAEIYTGNFSGLYNSTYAVGTFMNNTYYGQWLAAAIYAQFPTGTVSGVPLNSDKQTISQFVKQLFDLGKHNKNNRK